MEHNIDFEIPADVLEDIRLGGGQRAPETGRYAFELVGFRVSGMSDSLGSRFIEPEVKFVDATGFTHVVRGERDGSLRWPWTDDNEYTPEILAMEDDKRDRYLGAIFGEHLRFAVAFSDEELDEEYDSAHVRDEAIAAIYKEGGIKLTDFEGNIGWGEWLEPQAFQAPANFEVTTRMRFGRVDRWLSASSAVELEEAGVPVKDQRPVPWADDDADADADGNDLTTPPEEPPAAAPAKKAGSAKAGSAKAGGAKKPKGLPKKTR